MYRYVHTYIYIYIFVCIYICIVAYTNKSMYNMYAQDIIRVLYYVWCNCKKTERQREREKELFLCC